MNLSGDGSFFQSPSATACAFLATGNQQSMAYLESLIQRCPNGGKSSHFLHVMSNVRYISNLFSYRHSLWVLTGRNFWHDLILKLSKIYFSMHAVPAMYPIDAELTTLCLVNQIQRLGLAEHFTEEIEEILKPIYK